jgi:hypothetical protein
MLRATPGCSQPTKLAPKWAAPIPSHPKSHNHCDEVLLDIVVPVERIELPTFGLQNRCSTAELNRLRY